MKGTVSAVDSTRVIVSRAVMNSLYVPIYGVVAFWNLTRCYNKSMWEVDNIRDFKYQCQSKDNAKPLANESALGLPRLVVEPEEYPADFLDEFY